MSCKTRHVLDTSDIKLSQPSFDWVGSAESRVTISMYECSGFSSKLPNLLSLSLASNTTGAFKEKCLCTTSAVSLVRLKSEEMITIFSDRISSEKLENSL